MRAGVFSIPFLLFAFSLARADDAVPDLKFGVYVTTDSVQRLATDAAVRAKALELLPPLHITDVFVEFYRGEVVNRHDLETVRDFFHAHGFTVMGGIATVPGDGFGVHEKGPLGWFNWQNPKTQTDLKQVMRDAAPVFDTIIVDDFLCTGDTSDESIAAKGDRSWSQYRRDLMVDMARNVLIGAAREAKPGIRMIIKYPQWYDLFHIYGYDLAREPELFDAVWVGTESRGSRTQRFGFTQPYEGFINFRWIKSIAKEKVQGAWFDEYDCDGDDFLEQAYQSVLAGAPEIVFFSYADIAVGHPGYPLAQRDFGKLNRLSKHVRANPVVGIPAYKPVNSDGGDDLYLLDQLGMLGIPIIPVSAFPADAPYMLLPEQSASDANVAKSLRDALAAKKSVILTCGFLSKISDPEICALAGIKAPVSSPIRADAAVLDGKEYPLPTGLDLAADISLDTATPLLSGKVKGHSVPFLMKREVNGATIFVLNSHTFSQADFDAVHEVLLSPRRLGLLELPEPIVGVLRNSFIQPMGLQLRAPTRVALQALSDGSIFIHNFNVLDVKVRLRWQGHNMANMMDMLGRAPLLATADGIDVTLSARSRAWLASTKILQTPE